MQILWQHAVFLKQFKNLQFFKQHSQCCCKLSHVTPPFNSNTGPCIMQFRELFHVSSARNFEIT